MDEDLQKTTIDTPQGETPVAQGTVSTDGEDTTQVETEPKEEMVSKAEFERLRLEHEKTELRKNQLENQLEKAVNAGDSTETAKVLEELRAENEALKADREKEALDSQIKTFEQEMTTVFDTVLEGYPEEVKVAARFMKEKNGINSIVGEIQYGFQAEKNIKDYLDGLSEGFKVLTKPEIKIDATNPSVTPNLSEEALLEQELAKPEKERNLAKIAVLRLGKRM